MQTELQGPQSIDADTGYIALPHPKFIKYPFVYLVVP